MHPFDTPKLDRKLGVVVVLLQVAGSQCRISNVPCVYFTDNLDPFRDDLCMHGWRQCARSRPDQSCVFVSLNDALLIRLRGDDNTT